MTATLDAIRNKVRRVTARYTTTQMTTAQIDEYINSAYIYDLPEHIRNIKLKVPYVFLTTPNVDTYNFPYQNGFPDPNGDPGDELQGYLTVEPPAYCQGYLLRYFQDKTLFYGSWPKRTQLFQVNTGDGTVGPYTGTVPFTPFLRADIDIFGNVIESAVIFSAQQSGFTVAAQDVSFIGDVGTLGGPDVAAGSTVNYLTGAYSVEFTVPVPSGVPINVQVIPYQPSRPVDMLFYNNQFVLRPVPQDVYQVEIQAYKIPTAMIAGGDLPELNEWWQLLAYMAGKKIYADFPDPEGLAYVEGLFQEQLQLVQRRTLKQYNTQRAATIFSVPSRPNYAGYFYGQGY